MEQWTQDEAIAFECAREVITDLMGIQSGEIQLEENKPKPDQARIDGFKAELSRLFKERAALTVTNQPEIARVRSEYGAIVRAWRETHKAAVA
ncbi:MAG: hypothetical protein RBS14_01780 [Atribacterota bacterium]|jgi:hypothetical protein|nr:hypothetical protein [Atribacterota bacterium]